MGTCMSKKKRSSSSSSVSAINKSVSSSTPHLQPQAVVTVFKSQVEPEREASLKKENKQEAEEGQVKKEIFIIKHRKSYSDGGGNGFEKISKYAFSDGVASITMNNVAAEAKEVDEILLECGRLSRNPSGKALSSGERGRRRRKHSASKRSHDFDHCENDTTTNAIGNSGILCEDDDGLAGENQHQLQQHRHQRRRSPVASSERRRRTPSREKDQQQRSSSKERRVSRSPSKRPSDTTTCNPPSNNINNNTRTRPGKMLSVPPTVSSSAIDKSNNGGGAIMRVSVRRKAGAASPRSLSPARANGKGTLFSENQQQPSLNRNSSRKADQSPHRRNPLSEIDVNSLAYSQSANNNSNRFQSRSKREIEPQANQKTEVDTNNIESRMKKEQQEEEEVKEQSSMTENVNPRTACTVIPHSGLDNNLKPRTLTLTRSRSSTRSRDLDHLLNNETVGVPSQSYTSLLLEDIQNFHQKNNNNDNSTSITLPACVAKAYSILEAVADINSASIRSNFYVNHCAKRMPDSSIQEHPFVESEVNVSDDVMEPSLHKYVTVSRDGSLLGGGVFDMKDQGSSEGTSFTVSGQRHVGLSSSLKPNSGDSTDFWNSSKRECDFQRIGSGRFGDNKDVHAIPIVVTAAVST